MHHYSLPSLIIFVTCNKNKQTNSKIISCSIYPTPLSPFTQSRNQIHRIHLGLAGVSDVLQSFPLPPAAHASLVPHTNHLHHPYHLDLSSTWKISFLKTCLVIPLFLKLLFQLHPLNEVILFNSIICPLQVQFPYSEVYSLNFLSCLAYIEPSGASYISVIYNFTIYFISSITGMSGPCRLR